MVEGAGFEPAKAEPSDLQSDPFSHSGTPPQKLVVNSMMSIILKFALFVKKLIKQFIIFFFQAIIFSIPKTIIAQ